MTDHGTHLTEAERQTLADGSLPGSRELEDHLRGCHACAEDVARLRRVIERFARPVEADPPLAELWPAIRSRIEGGKVVSMASPVVAPRARRLTPRLAAAGFGVAAAIAAVMLLRPSPRAGTTGIGSTSARDSAQTLVLVADSVGYYQEEARVLLDRLELQRALIRPEAMASIQRDLRVIDQAIGELQLAIERDPRNPALRQLLASSYRQKVQVLRRAGNAG
jgi:hypothetical protein